MIYICVSAAETWVKDELFQDVDGVVSGISSSSHLQPGEPFWFVNATAAHFQTKFSDDLTTQSFSDYVGNLGADDLLIVDFYAAWCPHCQNFIVEFEQFASSCRGTRVHTAVVDCVNEASLCSEWNVSQYPTVFGGSREEFNMHKAKLIEPDLQALQQWAADRGIEVNVDSKFDANTLAVPSSPAAHQSADLWDAEVALAMFLHIGFREGINSDAQLALMNFTAAVCQSYPSPECSRSVCSLHRIVSAPAPDWAALTNGSAWVPCGRQSWDIYARSFTPHCQGSLPGKRGFTCGLWTLLHALVVSTPRGTGPQVLSGLRDGILGLFECLDCRTEFAKLPFDAAHIATDDDAILWLWNAHNQVNARLRLEERRDGTGDPEWPKAAWPNGNLCRGCNPHPGSFSSASDAGVAGWNLSEVARFMRVFYSRSIGGRRHNSFLQ